MRLYFELGVSQRSLDLAESLDIKQVQRDTLSYLFTDDLEFFGGMKQCARICRDVLQIHDRNEIETPEMILHAFKFGTFSKIPEFIDFKTQLHCSVQKAVSNRQILRAEILGATSYQELMGIIQNFKLEALSIDGSCPFLSMFCLIIDVESLYDNRDMTLIPKYVVGDDNLFSDIKGKRFPYNHHSKSNSWLQLHSFILLLYTQLLGKKSDLKFGVLPTDFDYFLKNAQFVIVFLSFRNPLKHYQLEF
jgi:hypothetical protein